MQKALLLLIYICFPCSVYATDCETLKKQKFMPGKQTEDIRSVMLKFEACGFDTLDLYHVMPTIIAPAIIKLVGEKDNLTYGDVLSEMQKIKNLPFYEDLRVLARFRAANPQPAKQPETIKPERYVCDTPVNGFLYSKYRLDELFRLGVYFNYDQALACARETNKQLLVYFTCISCINARKMERNVLANDKIRDLLRQNFVIAALVVDSESEGDALSDMQTSRFGSNSQPSFYILDTNEKAIAESSYEPNVDNFIGFLQSK